MIIRRECLVRTCPSNDKPFDTSPGAIEISDEENEGQVYFTVTNGPEIMVNLKDLLEAMQAKMVGSG